MKLKGKKNLSPSIEIIVFPRDPNSDGTPGDLVFKAKAVNSMQEFDDLCPKPTPPRAMLPGGHFKEKDDDPAYVKALEERGSKRMAYMILKSLEATEDLEWESVNLKDHTTWLNYETELREAGLTDIEVNRIVLGVMRANTLDESKLDEARERFLKLESQRTSS